MATINLDIGALLDITVKKNHSFDLELPFFQEDGTTPMNLTGTFKMAIAKDAEGVNVEMQLTAGNGLTIAGNKVSISRSKIQMNLAAGTYYYDLRNDKEDGKSVPVIYGRIIVKGNIAIQL